MQPLIENVRMAADTLRNAAEKYGIWFSQSHIPYRSLSVKFDVEMAKAPGGLEFFSDVSLRSVEISHIMGCKADMMLELDASRMPLSLQVNEMRMQRLACEHLVSFYK